MDEGAGEAFFYGGDMKEIHINHNKTILLDDDDFDRLNKFHWYTDASGYANRRSSRKDGHEIFLMHREILGLSKGDGICVDHKNMNKLDNRKCNIRICTRSQNVMNTKNRPGSFVNAKGIYFCKETNKYRVRIKFNGKKIELGRFSDLHDAELAYEVASKKYHGDFSNTGK